MPESNQEMPMTRPFAALAAAVLLALALAACGSGEDAPAGGKTMSFKLTDAGCEPHDAKAPAGPITFEVENAGTSAVSEFEVLEGDSILGEKENLSEGLSGTFTLSLDAGRYTLYCPGGEQERGTLTVTGRTQTSSSSPGEDAAVAGYRDYLERNAGELVERTERFVAAVRAGDVARARSLYAPARVPYERIEPVAESFGDLDPRIDARANDIPADRFGGFHRIEKALWAEGSLAGMAPVGQRLLGDVRELRAEVGKVRLQAVQIANGANELLGEVSASKITGEEERYSHLDLVDFDANLEGAHAAFLAVRPLLESGRRTELAKEVEADFHAAGAALAPYRRGGGFVSYTALSAADTRKLAGRIDTLAEKLSVVPAQIAA
jgi:iron uptake system component EfeO